MAKRPSSTSKAYRHVVSIQTSVTAIHNVVANFVDAHDGTRVAKRFAGEDVSEKRKWRSYQSLD